MTENLEKLIKIYSENPVNLVEANGQMLLEAFQVSSIDVLFAKYQGFLKDKEKVINLKRDIENAISTGASPRTQLAEQMTKAFTLAASNTLDPISYNLEMDIRELLIRNCILGKWATDDKKAEVEQFFNDLFPRIRNWNVYFLSYTNREAYPINLAFKKIIRQFIYQTCEGKSISDDEVIRKRNLLAEVKYDNLRKANLSKGFYDKEAIDWGNQWLDKIYSELKNSFVFVQLITRSSFLNTKDNWMLKEYESFKEVHDNDFGGKLKNRYFFLICSEFGSVFPENIPLGYESWCKFIKDTQIKTMTPKSTVDDFRNTMSELSKSILDYIKVDLLHNSIPQ